MKANVISIDLIELVPENDADIAILRNFSGYSTNDVYSVSISSAGNEIGVPLSERISLWFQPVKKND